MKKIAQRISKLEATTGTVGKIYAVSNEDQAIAIRPSLPPGSIIVITGVPRNEDAAFTANRG